MVLRERKNRIGIIRLNRVEKRNAFSPDLIKEMYNSIKQYNQDPELRAILIVGEGPAFSAGADLAYLRQMRNNSLSENEEDSRKLADMFLELYRSPKLTFSAVNGYALAGGCGLAAVTDFCYAGPDARFGFTEVQLGFIPAVVMVFLSRKLSGAHLRELLLTGEIIGPEKALSIRLVHELIREPDFEDAVISHIEKYCNQVSGEAVSLTKSMIIRIPEMNLEEALHYAATENARARSTQDCIKGIDAFLDKKKINW